MYAYVYTHSIPFPLEVYKLEVKFVMEYSVIILLLLLDITFTLRCKHLGVRSS
jgi:hypothetical protein